MVVASLILAEGYGITFKNISPSKVNIILSDKTVSLSSLISVIKPI
jgi:hypothetical protein